MLYTNNKIQIFRRKKSTDAHVCSKKHSKCLLRTKFKVLRYEDKPQVVRACSDTAIIVPSKNSKIWDFVLKAYQAGLQSSKDKKAISYLLQDLVASSKYLKRLLGAPW